MLQWAYSINHHSAADCWWLDEKLVSTFLAEIYELDADASGFNKLTTFSCLNDTISAYRIGIFKISAIKYNIDIFLMVWYLHNISNDT